MSTSASSGAAGIANGKHMPSLKQVENVRMVAFCDIVEERAKRRQKNTAQKTQRFIQTIKSFLKNDSIEVVHVLTPNNAHAPLTIDALEAGKHVMCEKPMAKTYAEAKAMLEASKRTGKLLTIGYQNRRRADSTYLKRACDNGDLERFIMQSKGDSPARRTDMGRVY